MDSMKKIVFDLDGTLIDSHIDITASVNFVRERLYGLPPMATGKLARLLNDTDVHLPMALYGLEAYEARAKEMFEIHYARQCLQNARVFTGIPELLCALRNAGWQLYVATNAPTMTSRLILKNNGIGDFFQGVIGADGVEHPKPHPEMIEKLLGNERIGAWMVGDSPKDVEAARRAGIRSVFVTWGYSKNLPEKVRSDACAAKPEELFLILEN